MSSTKRGAKRHEADFYPTPAWAVRALFEATGWRPETVLDPCAGDGAILRVAREYGAGAWACELREACRDDLRDLGPYWIGDALGVELEFEPGDVVITNPPFRLAHEFVERWAIGYHRAAFLLPLTIFRGQKWAEWWQGKEPAQILTLPRRPSFVAFCQGDRKAGLRSCGRAYPLGAGGDCECGGRIRDGSDSQDYGWMLWGVEPARTAVKVLPLDLCRLEEPAS